MNIKLFAVGLLAAALIAGCGGAKQETTGSQPAPASQTTPAPAATGATGTYTVTGESTAQYTVTEKFANQQLPSPAIGKTSAITGELVLENGTFLPSTVTVDVKSLASDKSKRDQELQTRGLESAKYPTAEFRITGVDGTAPVFAEGQETAFKLKGALKLHGVEKAMVWDAKAKLQGDTLTLTATIKFVMGDFQIVPPDVLGLLTVDPNVQLDVNLAAKKQ
jgi:polyisoprenoid-binding protein YceI